MAKQDKVDVPPELESEWEDFREHRRSLKAPMSAIAERRNLRLLAKLEAEGNSPFDVIDQSIRNGWKGLFAVKATGSFRAARQDAFISAIFSSSNNVVAEVIDDKPTATTRRLGR